MGKKKTKLADRLPDWTPNDIQGQWVVALLRLRRRYRDEKISAFLRVYLQHPPRLGLSTFSKKLVPRNSKPSSIPSERSAIPSDALCDVANLASALNAVKRVARHGIVPHLGPGAGRLLEIEQQNKQRDKKRKDTEPARKKKEKRVEARRDALRQAAEYVCESKGWKKGQCRTMSEWKIIRRNFRSTPTYAQYKDTTNRSLDDDAKAIGLRPKRPRKKSSPTKK